jgi:hypothetical protein
MSLVRHASRGTAERPAGRWLNEAMSGSDGARYGGGDEAGTFLMIDFAACCIM